MLKYKIEGGIDFFAELYKSLDIEENDQKTDEDNKLCLISNNPLIDKYFEMNCGHKFNYIPLYLDIKNHKQKFNGLEGTLTRLGQDEIRCPYCREKQTGVLPYYAELGLEKLHGVNYIDPKYSQVKPHAQFYKTCNFLTPNPNFDPNGINSIETHPSNFGNCKFLKCFHMGTQISYQHGLDEGINYGDEKYYCWSHKKQTVKKYKKDIADKAKGELKQAKLKEKEQAKEAKLKEKEELKKSKKMKATILEENIVLGPTIIINESVQGCTEILKSGPNKGKPCGCKIVSDNRCKRHIPTLGKVEPKIFHF